MARVMVQLITLQIFNQAPVAQWIRAGRFYRLGRGFESLLGYVDLIKKVVYN